MATVHHPPLKGVAFQHNASRAWIWLSIVLAVLLIGAIAWSVSSPSVSETATVKTVTSTELDHEVSAGYHVQQPGVTTQYGNSGETVTSTELDHEVSAGYHVQQPGVTTQYGNSGELYPEK
jgi:lipopolysaccharide export system protein LptC